MQYDISPFSIWLASLNNLYLHHVATNGIISFFFMSNIPL